MMTHSQAFEATVLLPAYSLSRSASGSDECNVLSFYEVYFVGGIVASRQATVSWCLVLVSSRRMLNNT